MLYTDLFVKREKKVSVLLFVPLLMVIIIFVNLFFKTSPPSSRALSNFPKQVKILTPTDNQAIIFWETNNKEISYLLFGENKEKINQIILDDRDSQSMKMKRFFHLATVNNLKSNQEYYFRIVTEKKVFNNLNNQPFRIKIDFKKESVFTSSPLYGKVIDRTSRGLPDAVLIFNSDNQALGITISKSNGDWLVVLRQRNKTFNNEETIIAEIYSEDLNKSIVKGKINNFSPLEFPIVIGKNYDLTKEDKNVLSSSIGGKSQDLFQIIYPQKNAIIPGTRPLIKGLSLPDREVNVILKSKSIYSFKTKADKKGQWQVNLSFDLLAGDYQLEASSFDEKGDQLKRSLNFKIIKSGEQVLGEATPSATLVPSPTLTPIQSPSPFLSSTNVPSPTIYKTGGIESHLYTILAFIFLAGGLFLVLAY